MTEDELIEQLADKEHASWARWMEYLFSKCDDWYETDIDEQGVYAGKLIPRDLVERWQRQIETGYQSLTDTEKQTCRNEAVHALPIIEEYTKAENVAAFITIMTKAAKEFSESRTPPLAWGIVLSTFDTALDF